MDCTEFRATILREVPFNSCIYFHNVKIRQQFYLHLAQKTLHVTLFASEVSLYVTSQKFVVLILAKTRVVKVMAFRFSK